MSSLAELLVAHVGHRTTIQEPQPGRSLALKCFTCHGRLTDLSQLLRPGTPAPNQRQAPRDPRPDETCPGHPGEFRTGCRCCAADARAIRDGQPPPISQIRTGADPSQVPEWQRARAELEARTRARKTAQALEHDHVVTPPETTVDEQDQAEGSTQ